MDFMTTLLLIFLLVIVPLGAFFVYLYWWSIQRSNPQLEGTLRLPGLTAPVEVLRDKHGVPHLYAQTIADLLRAQGARVVLRWLRGVVDFDYEFQLAGMNARLLPGIETLFMTPGEDFRHVSATLVREIALMGGDVAQFVSPIVLERLRERVAARARGA